MARNEVEEIDFAIIGAGVAGTYCAWRLQKVSGNTKKIVLFEHSNRIGGRFLTLRFPKSGLKAELGGMRYLPMQKGDGSSKEWGHLLMTHLIEKEFELETEDFPMGSFQDEEWGDNNYAYFRGQHFKIKDLKDPEKSTAFKVNWSEKGMSPNALQEYVQTILVPGADKLDTLQDWMNVSVFDKKLWKYGFWNLLYRVLSPEAYLLLKYGSGYDSNASNGNAVALLPIVRDYLSTTRYRTLKHGMMSLPQTLAEKFASLEGVFPKGKRIRLNHRLDSITKEPDEEYYNLDFVSTVTFEKNIELTIDTQESLQCRAKNVILAIPTVALQKIRWKEIQTNKQVIDMINSSMPQEAVKLVLQYPYAWWKALGLFRGRSISDLPLRQTFYLSDLQDLQEPNPFKIKDAPSLLMASYSDIEAVPFWHGLEGVSPSHTKEDFPGPACGYRASRLMVEEAHRQVMEIHGQSELPLPTQAAYFDWGDSPFGAAWHAWRPGYKFDDVIDRIRRPLDNERVFICGEAYSALQGWAEGALNTAEQLLTGGNKGIGSIDKVDWLPPLLPEMGLRGLTGEEYSPLRVDSKGRRY